MELHRDCILELVRCYALARWGVVPAYLKITLPDGREQVEIIPSVTMELPARQTPTEPAVVPAVVPATPPPAPATQPPEHPAEPPPKKHQGEPWHNTDFSRLKWPGLPEMTFGAKQAAIVSALWDAAEDDDTERDQAELLRLADSECTRLSDLFRGHPAWGVVIVRGTKRGSYRLASVHC